jgi:hypothetical protein
MALANRFFRSAIFWRIFHPQIGEMEFAAACWSIFVGESIVGQPVYEKMQKMAAARRIIIV